MDDLNYKETIIIKAGKKYSFIKTDKIKWIESDSGYLKIYVEDKYYVVAMTLQNIEKKLDPYNFKRISRSKIINVLKIKEMTDSEDSNEFTVILSDSTILKWARRYRSNFPKLLLLK